jgi:hypothetical protein
MLHLAYRTPRSTSDWYFIGAVAAFVILMMILVAVYHRRRRGQIALAAQNLGLARVDARAPEAGYVHRPQPRECRFALEVCAVGVLEGRAARIAEYNYATPSGKSHLTHHNLQVSLECPDDWPAIRIPEVYGIAERPAEQLLWVNPAGNPPRPWAADHAQRLLSANVRALLAMGGRLEAWDIGDGWLTCTWRKSCTGSAAAGAAGPDLGRAQRDVSGLDRFFGAYVDHEVRPPLSSSRSDSDQDGAKLIVSVLTPG